MGVQLRLVGVLTALCLALWWAPPAAHAAPATGDIARLLRQIDTLLE